MARSGAGCSRPVPHDRTIQAFVTDGGTGAAVVSRPATVPMLRSPPLRTPVPVRLPQDLLAWLDRLAADQAEPRSTVIRQLLRAEMQRQQRSRRRSIPDAE